MTDEKQVNLDEWYTAVEAAERLTANSGKPVDKSYPRTLARYGKIRALEIGKVRLYKKSDVDVYVVEERGEKSHRAQRQKSQGKSRQAKNAA
jgi:hypothetical protein